LMLISSGFASTRRSRRARPARRPYGCSTARITRSAVRIDAEAPATTLCCHLDLRGPDHSGLKLLEVASLSRRCDSWISAEKAQ
jgi:predicted kinase